MIYVHFYLDGLKNSLPARTLAEAEAIIDLGRQAWRGVTFYIDLSGVKL